MDGDVYGSLAIPDCEDGSVKDFTCSDSVAIEDCQAFRLDVTFVAMQAYPDHSATIRLQKGGTDFALTDGVLFQIRDTRLLRGRLGEPLPVGQDENIRGALGLFDTCAGSTQNFELTGQILFDRFGVSKGTRVTGRIIGVEIRDGRGDGAGTVLGFIQGRFDFDVRLGPPYQRFQE
ncbi:MAG: hypothetical protein VYA30_09735 [Myxococcota bacterium]|nr:hypothetical protein [Myxococcota bacterium]